MLSREQAEAAAAQLIDGDIGFDEVPAAPSLRLLLDYWNGKRIAGCLPARADLDPLEIRHLLPDLLIFDLVDGGADFRVRLVGTGVVEAFGFDGTGKLLSTLFKPVVSNEALRLYRLAAEWGAPMVLRATMHYWRHRDHIAYECLHLPLATDGATVDKLLMGFSFRFRSPPA